MKKNIQCVWVLKVGEPKIDRKKVCKTLGIAGGVYTHVSPDTPTWIMEGMGNLAQTIPIIEESFSYGKYTLLSFPAKCIRSPAITMLRLEFSQRLHAQYWLCPHYSEKIQNLLTAYEKLRDTRAKILDANDEFIREYASAARSLGSPFEALAAESIVEDTFIPAITLYEEINERVATALRGLVQRNFEDATLVYAT